ncbi:type 1 fimbrial protein [Salmonella enterica]|nr:type 1 fimbrial protein [Salmonella enterica]EDT2961107.1 type 1 fimbrial protein [Salmonella enterica subsp. enterica]EEJ7562434.1 type 1 fimbrial protein [Salmonella enterica subsp. salamae]EBQ2135879.1 type 1 fimbrial protein [Salmonella enterica]EHS6108774.1 type 1 fimbrial protein [Salmonella enterica]
MNLRVNKALMPILICGILFSGACAAVRIDINGTVIASPCVVNGGLDSLSVSLGDNIQADSLSTAGSTTDWANFKLALTACPASTSSFSVAFSGTPDASDNAKYSNTGTATNLNLELTTQDGATVLSNGTSIDNVAIPATSHAYDLLLRTRAVSKGSVMPGTILGQVQATFTYQ